MILKPPSLPPKERSYLSTPLKTHIIGNEFRVLPKWENSGATPANPMKNHVSWSSFNGEPPAIFGYPDLDRNGQPLPDRKGGISFFLGPKAVKYAETLRIPLAVMELVRKGEMRLFSVGLGRV